MYHFRHNASIIIFCNTLIRREKPNSWPNTVPQNCQLIDVSAACSKLIFRGYCITFITKHNTTMKAIWNGAVIAESNDTIIIEGNHYFPPNSIKKELFSETDTSTSCFWKGKANYYTITVDGKENKDAAWYYPEPTEAVGDIKNYLAFWRGVEVVD